MINLNIEFALKFNFLCVYVCEENDEYRDHLQEAQPVQCENIGYNFSFLNYFSIS